MKHPLLLPLLAAIAFGLASCASVKTAVSKIQGPLKPTATKTIPIKKTATPVKAVTAQKSTFARLQEKGFKLPSLFRKTPPVVEIKKAGPSKAIAKKTTSKKSYAKKTSSKKATTKKSKPSKADLLAWKKKESAKKEKALVPKDFDPSDLDVDGQIPSYGILPSLKPGGSTSIEDIDEAAILPADVANLPSIPSIPSVPSIPKPVRTPDLSTVPDYLKPVGPVPSIKRGE